jgi:hypothetical protein
LQPFLVGLLRPNVHLQDAHLQEHLLGGQVTLALTPLIWAPVDATGEPLGNLSITFTPAADAVTGGAFVSAEPVTVRPGRDGTITTALVSGIYTAVITAGQRETLCAVTIPVSSTAVDLDTLLPSPLP